MNVEPNVKEFNILNLLDSSVAESNQCKRPKQSKDNLHLKKNRKFSSTLYGLLLFLISSSALGLELWIEGIPNSSYHQSGNNLTVTLGTPDPSQVTWVNFKLTNGNIDGVLGGTPNAPFTYTYNSSDLTMGINTITLGVRDSQNNWYTVQADIEVHDGSSLLCHLAVFDDDLTFLQGESIPVELFASSTGNIDKVLFKVNNKWQWNVNGSPYQYSYSTDTPYDPDDPNTSGNWAVGQYELKATIKTLDDPANYFNYTATITIEQAPLTIEIEDLHQERRYRDDENVPLTLNVSDAQQVDRVIFKLNDQWKFTDTSQLSTYTFDYGVLPVGAHTLTCNVKVKGPNETFTWKSTSTNVYISENGQYDLWPMVGPSQTYDNLYLETGELETGIREQTWHSTPGILSGWDWSLPPNVAPSDNSILGLQRKGNLGAPYIDLNLTFNCNEAAVLWCSWKELQPDKNEINLTPLKTKLEDMRDEDDQDRKVVLRILTSSRMRNNDTSLGNAPLWLDGEGVDTLPVEGSIENYNPAHTNFRSRYDALIRALGDQGVSNLVDAAYVGYPSKSFGDEGIGPHDEFGNPVDHVEDRLDAWAYAFEGQTHKVFMGGFSQYGASKGFGIRHGFVEYYTYMLPNSFLGQSIDDDGYIVVDDSLHFNQANVFSGDENEEYEEKWAQAETGNRFGYSTDSFPYRYFMSTLRAMQMRRSYMLTTGHLVPEMVPFLGKQLARNVNDSPDVWTFLTTSYINDVYYSNNDHLGRTITAEEQKEGIEAKNFERWLYQRDAPGYEIEPRIKIMHPDPMGTSFWMAEPDKEYDLIARGGAAMGFRVHGARHGNLGGSKALKVTYFDRHAGKLALKFETASGVQTYEKDLNGDATLKTATFFISGMIPERMLHDFDFTLEAGGNAEEIVVSMVRLIDIN